MVRRDLLVQSFNDYTQAHDELSGIQDISEEELKMYNSIQGTYLDLIVKIDDYIEHHNKNKLEASSSEKSNNNVNNCISGSDSLFKLPNIEIQSFSATNITEYKTGISLFNAVIDSNAKLSPIQKLFYLLKYLTGNARALIDKLPLMKRQQRIGCVIYLCPN